MLLSEILPRAVLLYPQKIAVSCGPTRLTYAELAVRVGSLALALQELGVEPGQRVGVLHRNCHRLLELYFAAVHAGAVLVPLNYRLTARDLATIIDDTQCRIMFADRGWQELALCAAELAKVRPEVIWSVVDPAKGDSSCGYESLVNRVRGEARLLDGVLGSAELLQMPPTHEDDPANIYYTSGTTGHQKGVVLTHRNIASHALATIADLNLRDEDVWAHVAPMFHLADAWATWAITWVGGQHVMVGKFDPPAVWRTLADHHVTVTNLIPTMLNDLVNHLDKSARSPSESWSTSTENRGLGDSGPKPTQSPVCASMRLLMSGGAPISPQLVRRVVDVFGCEYVQTYGLTETSPYLTFSLLKEHLKQLPYDEQMYYRSLTGRPALGVRLRLVDEQGRDIDHDGQAVGEIIVRGDRVTPGYWRLPEATQEAFSDGWFHTGDLATIDAEGYVNIVDRKKDIILTGGEVVYSTEVENALYEHPAVLEAAVVATPDERLGEVIHAVIVLKRRTQVDEDDIQQHCRRLLARYKCPRKVTFLDALPRTGSGKISKQDIRERFF